MTGGPAHRRGHARAALAAAAGLQHAVDEVNHLVRGRLTVGMVTACTVDGLFDALAGFHEAHPGVAVSLVEDDSAGLVRSGTADLALIGAAGSPPPDLQALTLISEGVAVAAVPGHPLLDGPAPVRLAAQAGFPVICLPPGTGVRAVLDQACAERGVGLTVALEASAPTTVADLAARGLGVAVLSESLAVSLPAAQAGRLNAAPVADATGPALLALVWRPAPGPAVQALLKHCHRAPAAG